MPANLRKRKLDLAVDFERAAPDRCVSLPDRRTKAVRKKRPVDADVEVVDAGAIVLVSCAVPPGRTPCQGVGLLGQPRLCRTGEETAATSAVVLGPSPEVET